VYFATKADKISADNSQTIHQTPDAVHLLNYLNQVFTVYIKWKYSSILDGGTWEF
jgi:hypothetical protein